MKEVLTESHTQTKSSVKIGKERVVAFASLMVMSIVYCVVVFLSFQNKLTTIVRKYLLKMLIMFPWQQFHTRLERSFDWIFFPVFHRQTKSSVKIEGKLSLLCCLWWSVYYVIYCLLCSCCCFLIN